MASEGRRADRRATRARRSARSRPSVSRPSASVTERRSAIPFDVDELTDSGEHDLTEVFNQSGDYPPPRGTGRSRLAPLDRGTRTAAEPGDSDEDSDGTEPDGSSGVKAGGADAGGTKTRAPKTSGSAKSSRGRGSSRRSRSAASGRKHSVVDRLAGLTNRWSNRTIGMAMIVIVAAIAVALTLSAPLRNSMSDRSEFARLSASNSELRKQIAYYEQKINEQNDPAYIEAQARERLHFVYPGEKAVVMMYPGDDARKAAERKAAEHADNPWYSNLWQAVATPPKK